MLFRCFLRKSICFLVLIQRRKFEYCLNMNTFTQKFNPITGKNEWVMQPENYDFLQEIARSAYGDMLHDTERNHKYFLAIKKAVAKVKAEGRKAKVLDVGTGTGLLSMMAALSGADTVYACEAFLPVAKCAVNVIKDNELEHKITVIPKRSTDLTVGEDGDLPEKANILVTEVFDTELIGEGALGVFRHALAELLDENCIVVPSSATIYAQIIESKLISNFNTLRPFCVDEQKSIVPYPELRDCTGASAVHDIQMSEIPQTDFKVITDPVAVFHFDFTGKHGLKLSDENTKIIAAKQSGHCEAVFMWWELHMDDTILLSCAPPWSHPEPSTMQWRDHWMQGIYYLPQSLFVNQSDQFRFHAHHDEYSLWFNVSSNDMPTSVTSHPICTCTLHCSNSRTRIGLLNDPIRREKYAKILKKLIKGSSTTCLSIGDGNFFALLAASLGAKVLAIEQNTLQRNILKNILQYNGMEIKLLNVSTDELESSDVRDKKYNFFMMFYLVDVLFGEPYLMSGLLPWDSLLHFWHTRSILDKFLSKSFQISPERGVIKAVAVEFKDLWKIRAPVNEAEGFNLSSFDKMTQESIAICDNPVEPHPLWEYPCKPLCDVIELMSFDLTKCVGSEDIETFGFTEFSSDGQCNGIALWVDFETNDVIITTGPMEPVIAGTKITWDMYTRQGVHFIQPSAAVKSKGAMRLFYKVTFNPAVMDIKFDFQIKDV